MNTNPSLFSFRCNARFGQFPPNKTSVAHRNTAPPPRAPPAAPPPLDGALTTDSPGGLSIVFSRCQSRLSRRSADEDAKSATRAGQDNGSELKFPAVPEQSCRSGCHLKQRWQTRQWRTAPIAAPHKTGECRARERDGERGVAARRRRGYDGTLRGRRRCVFYGNCYYRGAVAVYNWDEKGTRLKFLLVRRCTPPPSLMCAVNFNFNVGFSGTRRCTYLGLSLTRRSLAVMRCIIVGRACVRKFTHQHVLSVEKASDDVTLCKCNVRCYN